MEFQAWRLSLFTELVRILVKMIDPGGVETAGSALDAMYDITFLQQKLSEVAAVLACDPGDQGMFAVAHDSYYPLSTL